MMTPRFLDLLAYALSTGDSTALETHLLVPDPDHLHAFAAAVGAYLDGPDPEIDALESLLDRWAADPAPATDPRIALPCAAAHAYAQAAVSRPEWWPDEIAKLRRLAADPRPPVREAAAAGLNRLGERGK